MPAATGGDDGARTAFFHQIDRHAHGGVFFTAQSDSTASCISTTSDACTIWQRSVSGELMLRERRANSGLLTDQQQARVGMGA